MFSLIVSSSSHRVELANQFFGIDDHDAEPDSDSESESDAVESESNNDNPMTQTSIHRHLQEPEKIVFLVNVDPTWFL